MGMEKWLPNLKDPKNEIVVFGNALIAFLSLLIPIISGSDFTTSDGIIAFIVAAGTMIIRQFVWSAGSVAELSAEPASEDPY